MLATATLPQPGNYSVTLRTRDGDGSYQNGSTIQAYPNLPFRMRAIDPAQDINVGARTTIAIESDDPINLQPTSAFDDLEVNVEHWSDDHATMFSTDSVTARHAGSGIWKIDYVFPVGGMHHLRFASRSGGFNMTDVPIMHLYATQQRAPAKSPGLGIAGVGAAGIAAALLLVRRKR